MPWPNRRVPTYTDADYVSMWEDMSRPPVEWVVLTEMVEEAEGKTEPNDRAYLLSEALKRLEKYIESTDEPSRMSAGKISAMRQRINKVRDGALAEMRAQKESERVDGAAAAARVSLVELMSRLTSSNPPIPFTPKELEALAQVPPFLSGPHVAKFDPKYIESFGHYNLAFVRWAEKAVSTLDGATFQALSPVYQTAFENHAQYLLGARYYLLANAKRAKELRGKYTAALQEKRPFNPIEEIPYVEGSYDGMYLAYWLRREIDGSAVAVQALLERAMERFQPGTLLALRKEYKRGSGVVLTLPGSYHSDELEIADGDKVFALVRLRERASLKADVAKVELSHDAVMDENGEASGKNISLKSTKDDGVMILRGGFKAGAVTTVKLPPLRECIAGCPLTVGPNRYTLTVVHVEESMPETLEEQPIPGFVVELRQGETTMHLRNIREIVWAGDLDRDGKLDLIYDDRFHYNVATSLHLMLSSESSGALPREVSHCISVGC